MATREEIEQTAWEWFAQQHPYEAAEMDWPRFVAYIQTMTPGITEDEVKAYLYSVTEE